MQMLGVPLEDMQLVIDCADSLVELFGATQADFELALRTQKHLVLMTEYLQGLIAERKVNPGNDVISLMLHSVDESGFQMSEDDVHGQCAMLLFAGHETTRNLVGNGVLALMQHPEQLQQLKENPALMRVAVQEILRYNSPVQMTMRAVTEDMEMFGQPVKKGQLVMFNYGAANHDPNHFQAPERFDIHRSESRHMSFGVGAHACAGSHLAMLEGEIALNTLLRRLPNVRLADKELEWHHNAGFRGLQKLELVWDAVR
jgi:cytochrome P450